MEVHLEVLVLDPTEAKQISFNPYFYGSTFRRRLIEGNFDYDMRFQSLFLWKYI